MRIALIYERVNRTDLFSSVEKDSPIQSAERFIVVKLIFVTPELLYCMVAEQGYHLILTKVLERISTGAALYAAIIVVRRLENSDRAIL